MPGSVRAGRGQCCSARGPLERTRPDCPVTRRRWMRSRKSEPSLRRAHFESQRDRVLGALSVGQGRALIDGDDLRQSARRSRPSDGLCGVDHVDRDSGQAGAGRRGPRHRRRGGSGDGCRHAVFAHYGQEPPRVERVVAHVSPAPVVVARADRVPVVQVPSIPSAANGSVLAWQTMASRPTGSRNSPRSAVSSDCSPDRGRGGSSLRRSALPSRSGASCGVCAER